MKWLREHGTDLGLGLAIVILGAVVMVSYQSITELVEAGDEVDQVIIVRSKLNDLLTHLLDAETSERGYLITGEESYLGPYEGAFAAVDQDMKDLVQMAQRDPESKKQLDALGPLIAAKQRKLQDTIDINKAKGFQMAREVVLTGQGKTIMDDIRRAIDQIKAHERQRWEQRSRERGEVERTAVWVVNFGVILAAVIASLSTGIRQRESRRRRRAERTLHVTDQRLQTLVAAAPLAIFALKPDFKVWSWNPAAQRTFGWTEQEIIGQPLPTVQLEAQDEARSLLERVKREGYVANVETRRRRKDGSLIDVSISAGSLHDANGYPAGIISIVADISERKQAERHIQQQMERISALRAIDRAIAGSLDLRLTLDLLLDQVIAQLQVDAADVLLLSQHTQTLEWVAGRGFRNKDIQRSHLRVGEGIAGRAALERRTVSLSNLSEADEAYTRRSLVAGEEFVAYHAVPLVSKGQVKGMLELFHRAPLEPNPEWINYMKVLAGQAAIAVDNAELFGNLQRSNMELILAYDTTIEAWSRALDLRDKETEGHSQRVTEMTVQLARVMGINDAILVHVRRGALLHDVGKIGIPDSVLLKPGPLTDEEWDIMRRHPVYAYELLSPIAFLRSAIDIPYCHHEKWDGTGYPRGLKGEQIPLTARIFAVVDVWDALRSDRPYRTQWPPERVCEHIQSLAGVHFDPNVVEQFVKLELDTETVPP